VAVARAPRVAQALPREVLTASKSSPTIRTPTSLAAPKPVAGRRHPGDHAFAAYYCKTRHHAIGIVVPADAEQIVQAAVPDVARSECAQPAIGQDEVSIEVGPEGLAPQASASPSRRWTSGGMQTRRRLAGSAGRPGPADCLSVSTENTSV
jgi:hypothetical protein